MSSQRVRAAEQIPARAAPQIPAGSRSASEADRSLLH